MIWNYNFHWWATTILFLLLCLCSCSNQRSEQKIPVLIVGDGTGATAAAIMSGRLGVPTLWLKEYEMLGGMLTNAGVSAIDGNHYMPSGMWGEFREALRSHYGGAENLATGWISHTLFEPHVGDSIFQSWVNELPNLSIVIGVKVTKVEKENENWNVEYSVNRDSKQIKCQIIIDGTDLGDVLELAGIPYDIGLGKDGLYCGIDHIENYPEPLIQDLTYAAILKDYGPGSDRRPNQPPANYDPKEFDCCCLEYCSDADKEDVHPCATMMSYARLPGDKYLINWPLKGNDYYVNLINKSDAEQDSLLQLAKDKTLRFIYFIQDQLAYKNLGLADDEFDTNDGLPDMPYHREGRRLQGLVRLELDHIINPHTDKIYRTGIAVGDYPVDHHHLELPDATKTSFPGIPSFNVPLGTLIPKDVDNFIVADKAISVSHYANGSARLQPVIMQIGQAAGAIAFMAFQEGVSTNEISVRALQELLLESGVYIMPYWDAPADHTYFTSIQRIGACGIIKGVGEPFEWANRTWVYPDSTISNNEIINGVAPFLSKSINPMDGLGTTSSLSKILTVSTSEIRNLIEKGDDVPLSRAEISHVIDEIIDPFSKEIDINGELIQDRNLWGFLPHL